MFNHNELLFLRFQQRDVLKISSEEDSDASEETEFLKISKQITRILKEFDNKPIDRKKAINNIRVSLNTYLNRELSSTELRILQGVLQKDFKHLEHKQTEREKLNEKIQNFKDKIMGFKPGSDM